jgi:large subunit ribosomal protein L4
MKVSVYSTDGRESGDIELVDSVFALPENKPVIWYAINAELANKRLGTASTKGRAEIHGSNAKPFKQKGTGRARRGDKKSPITVGGGIVFGPKPRDFSIALPRKVKQLALKTILSMRVKDGTCKIVDDFTIESGKTKDLTAALKGLATDERTVLVMKDDDANVKRAGRNIPWLSYMNFQRLRAHDLFYARKLLVMKSAAEGINKLYTEAVE